MRHQIGAHAVRTDRRPGNESSARRVSIQSARRDDDRAIGAAAAAQKLLLIVDAQFELVTRRRGGQADNLARGSTSAPPRVDIVAPPAADILSGRIKQQVGAAVLSNGKRPGVGGARLDRAGASSTVWLAPRRLRISPSAVEQFPGNVVRGRKDTHFRLDGR
jgi:hypothetical protein